MKKLFLTLIIALVPALSKAETLNTNIELGLPITITEVQQGFVGNIVYQTQDGEIALLPNGTIYQPVGFSGAASDAVVTGGITPIYSVSGSPNSTVTLTIDTSSSTMTSGSNSLLSFSGQFLPVGSTDTSQGSNTTAVTLNNNGTNSNVSNVYLAVYSSSSDVPGTYTTTYNVTASY